MGLAKFKYAKNWIEHPFLGMREGGKVMAHVKIQFVSNTVFSFTPKWSCTKFGLFKGKFRGLKTR